MPVIFQSPAQANGFGPCEPWEPIWCTDLPTGSEAISGTAIAAATEILWAKSGMRFDQCTYTVRPCRQSCFGDTWPFNSWWELGTYPQPAKINGNWVNLTCGSCPNTCSCTTVEQIVLPGPVSEILEVKVDGVVLPTTSYRLDDWRILIRVDGGIWPTCNNLNLADTEVGTWSVTLTYGQPVPYLGRMAVGELAEQLILACLGDDCCTLPIRVQQLQRQGVTITNTTVSDLIKENRIGLQFTDLFLDSVNPAGLKMPSQVYQIDGNRPRIVGA